MATENDDVVATHRWEGAVFSTVEEFTLSRRREDWVLEGAVVSTGDGDLRITYEVVADASWVTRYAAFEARVGDRLRSSRLEHAGGRWTVDGADVPALDGCSDVDLGWTPATNTLPIRRLHGTAYEGTPVPVTAAWVRMPDLGIVRLDQAYTRFAPDRWHYRSAGFEAELTVDEYGLVTRYGTDGLWVSDE